MMANRRVSSAAPLVPASAPRLYLAAEGLALFGGVPVGLFALRTSLSHLIIPILLLFSAFCVAVLWADDGFDLAHLWGPLPGGDELRRVAARFAGGAIAVTVAMAVWAPDLLLSFPRTRPLIWLALMGVYPLLSVYPQEVLFRAFLFHRYRPLLASSAARVLASTVAFAWAHVLFGNWTAPLLSVAGGWLFASTYARTGSLRLAAIEHAVWGGFVFTVGLGRYFFSGAI